MANGYFAPSFFNTFAVKTHLILLTCLAAGYLTAQTTPPPARLAAGLELDFLPYATGGYFGAAWVGKGHWRGRCIVAKATKPDFLLPDGYSHNTIRAYAVLADYFPRLEFSGWWLAGGFVYWDASIRLDTPAETRPYKSYLASAGAGYNWKFYRHFYLSPWAGLHVRVAGDDSVDFQTRPFKPPLFNPEGSLKVGWYF